MSWFTSEAHATLQESLDALQTALAGLTDVAVVEAYGEITRTDVQRQLRSACDATLKARDIVRAVLAAAQRPDDR